MPILCISTISPTYSLLMLTCLYRFSHILPPQHPLRLAVPYLCPHPVSNFASDDVDKEVCYFYWRPRHSANRCALVCYVTGSGNDVYACSTRAVGSGMGVAVMQCWTENRDFCALYRTKRRHNPCYSEVRTLRNFLIASLIPSSLLKYYVFSNPQNGVSQRFGLFKNF